MILKTQILQSLTYLKYANNNSSTVIAAAAAAAAAGDPEVYQPGGADTPNKTRPWGTAYATLVTSDKSGIGAVPLPPSNGRTRPHETRAPVPCMGDHA